MRNQGATGPKPGSLDLSVQSATPLEIQTAKLVLMQQVRPLPFQNFNNYRRLPPTNRNLLHAAVAAHFDRVHADGWWKNTFKYSKRWLFRVPWEIVFSVWHHGTRARRAYGKSVPRQIQEIIWLYVANGLGPDDYYMGGLATRDASAQMQMVPYWKYRDAVLFCMGVDTSSKELQRIRSKHWLAEDVRNAGGNAPKTLALIDPNVPKEDGGQGQINQSFFVKPDRGNKGNHAERWTLEGEKFLLAERDLAVPKDQIIDHLYNKAVEIDGTLVVQEVIENSDAMRAWAGTPLATTRIDSCRTPDGEITIGRAFLRMASDANASVDNLSRGGTGFNIEIDSGLLGPGFTDLSFGPVDYTSRSPATGEVITGQTVPQWDEAVDMVKHLHKTLSDLPVIGWDIGFSPDGPSIVEANVPTGIHITNQSAEGGFYNTPLADCLARCIVKRLHETQSKGSRFLVGAERPPDK
ncbi:MAG: sugar-transfer associated ATP-grasp domain-containing protein [Pseudomonadota bacterium]